MLLLSPPACSLIHLWKGFIHWLDYLEHKPGKYIRLAHDNEYVSYALLSLAGSMYLAGLCSKQSNYSAEVMFDSFINGSSCDFFPSQ